MKKDYLCIKYSCVRQIESKLSLRSLATSLHKILLCSVNEMQASLQRKQCLLDA